MRVLPVDHRSVWPTGRLNRHANSPMLAEKFRELNAQVALGLFRGLDFNFWELGDPV